MSSKGKGKGKAPIPSKKRAYLIWTTEMDETLIRVLYQQLKEGNKAEGEWKPQAYQAVADEIRTNSGTGIVAENVKNRIKSWKKHYAVITDIRTYSKFKWDEEKKMIVIGIDDLEQWEKFVEVLTGTRRSNIGMIYVLCGADRALGDEVEMHDEAAWAMDEENESEGGSSNKGTSSAGYKKPKRDEFVEVMSKFTEYFHDYVEKKPKEDAKPSTKEVQDVMKNVYGIGRLQEMRAVKRFLDGPVHDFEVLKSLPDDEKLDWVIICLGGQ